MMFRIKRRFLSWNIVDERIYWIITEILYIQPILLICPNQKNCGILHKLEVIKFCAEKI